MSSWTINEATQGRHVTPTQRLSDMQQPTSTERVAQILNDMQLSDMQQPTSIERVAQSDGAPPALGGPYGTGSPTYSPRMSEGEVSDNPVEPPDSDNEDRLSETELVRRYATRIHLQQRRREIARRLRQLRERQILQEQEQRQQQEQINLCWPRHAAWHATNVNQ